MNNRWKFQIIFGGMWALLVSVILVLIDLREMTFAEQFNSPALYIRTGITFLIGIFGFAWFIWKQQVRKRQQAEDANAQPPRQ